MIYYIKSQFTTETPKWRIFQSMDEEVAKAYAESKGLKVLKITTSMTEAKNDQKATRAD